MVKLSRAQVGRASGIDTTVKSATGPAQAFRPTWEIVTGVKQGRITEEQYTEHYISILDRVPKDTWRWLYDQSVNGEVTVLCYCRDDWFCHTHLLIDYAVAKWPKAFRR